MQLWIKNIMIVKTSFDSRLWDDSVPPGSSPTKSQKKNLKPVEVLSKSWLPGSHFLHFRQCSMVRSEVFKELVDTNEENWLWHGHQLQVQVFVSTQMFASVYFFCLSVCERERESFLAPFKMCEASLVSIAKNGGSEFLRHVNPHKFLNPIIHTETNLLVSNCRPHST